MKQVSELHLKNANRFFRLLVWEWAEQPELTLKELILSLPYTELNRNIRGKLKEVKQ